METVNGSDPTNDGSLYYIGNVHVEDIKYNNDPLGCLKILLKNICEKYPSARWNSMFLGKLSSAGIRPFVIEIYNTNLVNEEGIPQYANALDFGFDTNVLLRVDNHVASLSEIYTTANKPKASDINAISKTPAKGENLVYGQYVSLAERYSNAPITIREVGLVGDTHLDDAGYGPSVGFAWSGYAGGFLQMDSNAKLHYHSNTGEGGYAGRGTIVANLDGAATKLSMSSNIASTITNYITGAWNIYSLYKAGPVVWGTCNSSNTLLPAPGKTTLNGCKIAEGFPKPATATDNPDFYDIVGSGIVMYEGGMTVKTAPCLLSMLSDGSLYLYAVDETGVVLSSGIKMQILYSQIMYLSSE